MNLDVTNSDSLDSYSKATGRAASTTNPPARPVRKVYSSSRPLSKPAKFPRRRI